MSTPEERAKHAAYMREWKRRNPEKHAAIEARYEASPKGRHTRRRVQRVWKSRHPEAVATHNRVMKKVQWAVSTGRLVRQPCRECGATPVNAHHHNGYAAPLDVVWLCAKHHVAAHGRARAIR